jgi:hypothetical protein
VDQEDQGHRRDAADRGWGTDPHRCPQPRPGVALRIRGQIGLSFALIAAGVLLSIYFVQFSVVPVSLMNGQTEGIALLTQYNPYGVFIVLEELG